VSLLQLTDRGILGVQKSFSPYGNRRRSNSVYLCLTILLAAAGFGQSLHLVGVIESASNCDQGRSETAQ
jgi:hypothetical protein